MYRLIFPVIILLVGGLLYVYMYLPAMLNTLRDQIPGLAKIYFPDVKGPVAPSRSVTPPDPARLQALKDAQWAKYYRPHPKCATQSTALEELECRNDAENQRVGFETRWSQARTGARP